MVYQDPIKIKNTFFKWNVITGCNYYSSYYINLNNKDED